jgi:threonine/homoserine/homoserine lactone efflux protein
MIESLQFLISGALLGLAAGISPGPLLTLVISETLKHSKKEGVIIACAPLLTDIPVVLLSILILAELSGSNFILGIISFSGALFIGYLGYESITVKSLEFDIQRVKAQSLKRGLITNFLNPHPYLFWITVGAPMVIKGYKVNIMSSLFFISGFYLLLVGSKITVAFAVDKSKSALKSNLYIYVIRILGFFLLIFSIIFIKDGLRFFGII